MESVLKNAADLYVEGGGPVQRMGQRLAERMGLAHSTRLRILGFLAVTWLPLVVFAVMEGRALGPSPQESLLLDFGTYTRFFLGVPILILAEFVIGPRLRTAGMQFVEGGFVRREDYPAFDQAIQRVARWRESKWAELAILSVAFLGAWGLTAETMYGEAGFATWRAPTYATSTGLKFSLTGLWYHLVALPILQFFWYRWIWRLIVWIIFLGSVARLKLNLVATHADQAGGLGFLGTAHVSLAILAFGLSSVLCAEAAFLIAFQQVSIDTFQIPYIVILVLVELIVLGPLLVFTPTLIRTRLDGLRAYSLLVARYNRAFHKKWVEEAAAADESLLGSSDIQSLADLGTSFESLRGMKTVPFSQLVIIQIAVITSLPCLPLFLLVMPISKILNLLTKAVF